MPQDSNDIIHLAYRRADTTNGIDEIVYRYSTDAGMHWTTPVVVSRPLYDGGYVSIANRIRTAYGIDISWRESRNPLVDNESVVTPMYGNVTYSTTAVAKAETPVTYDVLSNYPNPFNPSTRISFTLVEPSEATLGIYDLNGRLVRTLHSGRMGEGAHTIEWDGSDAGGIRVSSGMYIAVLTTPMTRQNVKMLLLR